MLNGDTIASMVSLRSSYMFLRLPAAMLLLSPLLLGCEADESIIEREQFMQIASDELLSHYSALSRTDFALSDDRFVVFCVRADPCRAFLKFELVPGTEAYDTFEKKEVTVSVTEDGKATLELSRYGDLRANIPPI